MEMELYQVDCVKDGEDFFSCSPRSLQSKRACRPKPAHLRDLSKMTYGDSSASLKPNCAHDLSLLNLSEACDDTPLQPHLGTIQKVPSISDLSEDSQDWIPSIPTPPGGIFSLPTETYRHVTHHVDVAVDKKLITYEENNRNDTENSSKLIGK
ncbi:Hypothetical predicted protein [Octopus vulgaris]|nr:Hypothetical predicted protein [Octopus vulgaris]